MPSNSKTYLIRANRQQEADIQRLAEEQGITDTQACRNLLDAGRDAKSLELLLHNTEVRLLRKIFEICVCSLELNSQQREKARTLCNEKFKQELLL